MPAAFNEEKNEIVICL